MLYNYIIKNELLCCAVCYKLIAEEICSYVDLCFQSIYTDATMNFFDRSLIEGTQASARKDNAYSSELAILFDQIHFF